MKIDVSPIAPYMNEYVQRDEQIRTTLNEYAEQREMLKTAKKALVQFFEAVTQSLRSCYFTTGEHFFVFAVKPQPLDPSLASMQGAFEQFKTTFDFNSLENMARAPSSFAAQVSQVHQGGTDAMKTRFVCTTVFPSGLTADDCAASIPTEVQQAAEAYLRAKQQLDECSATMRPLRVVLKNCKQHILNFMAQNECHLISHQNRYFVYQEKMSAAPVKPVPVTQVAQATFYTFMEQKQLTDLSEPGIADEFSQYFMTWYSRLHVPADGAAAVPKRSLKFCKTLPKKFQKSMEGFQ